MAFIGPVNGISVYFHSLVDDIIFLPKFSSRLAGTSVWIDLSITKDRSKRSAFGYLARRRVYCVCLGASLDGWAITPITNWVTALVEH